MKKDKNKKSLANMFFLLGWSIYLISYILLKQTELMYMYDTTSIYQVVKVMIITICSIKMIFIDKYNFKKLLSYYIILTFVFINAVSIDNFTLFFSILIALSADNVDFEKFIKKDMKIRILLVVLIVGLSLMGVLPNFTRYINGSLKQGFGFLHPNFLCFFIITILLEQLYISKKVSLTYIIENIIIISLLIIFCFSRTSVLSFIIIFIANIIIRNKEHFFEKRFIKKILCLLPIILSVLSILTVFGYGKGNEISTELDEIFTERIGASYRFYDTYGIKLLGNEIVTVGTRAALFKGQSSNIFDMGYFRLLVNYGIIISIIIILLLCLLQKNIIKKKDYKLLLISTFFLLTGFAENNVYNIIMNFTLVFISYIFSKNNKVGEDNYE